MSVQFFMDNGGYSYDPKVETEEQGKLRSAERLAQAEKHALEMDWAFEWADDGDGWRYQPVDENGDPEGEQVEYCQLLDRDGNLLESLSGIWDASPEYKRVVEAELALQAMSAVAR